MTEKKPLSEYFRLNRRYSRSINLERDLEQPNTVLGYVPTQRSVDALRRIIAAIAGTQPTRAWTLTGVYGTGKSAFAHYILSLCAPESSQGRTYALDIAKTALGANSPESRILETKLPKTGLFRAVATGQGEPLSHTIIRALRTGAEIFWPAERTKPEIARKLRDLATEIVFDKPIDRRLVPGLVQEVAAAAQTDVLIVIDELGKSLEFAAQNQGVDDLYLLQQLAELPKRKGSQVYLLGLLHQAFAEYSQRLASKERNEWAKIQGRFEDIPFTESAEQMTRLIGQSIDHSGAEPLQFIIHKRAEEWFECLQSITSINDITPAVLADAYPLHPITSLVLPILCNRYAQNDRSLFSFLTSSEPYSFKNYLDEATLEGDSLPTLKLHQVYDYFVESVGIGLASRHNIGRWVEIQGLIADAKHLAHESQQVLKTIGTLNLVTSTGVMRATRSLVMLAMCDRANDSEELIHWEQVIEELLKRGLISYRRQLDELRIWEGSDFDVEGEIAAIVEKERVSSGDATRSPLVKILSEVCPLKPLVAQRHSYRTGTLRYFERQYFDLLQDLTTRRCTSPDCDGLVGYWVDDALPTQVPSTTADGKPLIVLRAAKLDLVRIRALEFAALKKIQKSAPQLQTDGVARREVRHRLVQARRLLDETLSQAFNVAEVRTCWIMGEEVALSDVSAFNAKLSEVCDRVYHESPILWNELINRRELTSQGAKARRELIEAILERSHLERLGLQGNGPEVSMYFSLLGETGIHRQEEGEWGFYLPLETPGVFTVWQAIEGFCVQAKEKPQTLDQLYQRLEAAPFGFKRGAIPVLLAAVLLHHIDDVSVYKDGTFIPVLGAEHFELLVKDPSRFAVKYFEVAGVRSQVFKELEAVLRSPNAQTPAGSRNVTLLAVVKPLFQFVKKLPAYTTKTKRLSAEAQAVLRTLQSAQEPDELLFTSLPQACGLSPIFAGEADDGTTAQNFPKKLVEVLREIQAAYDRLLSECQTLLYNAFGVGSSEKNLREDLGVRANYLVGGSSIEPILRRFTLAATDATAADKEWLEALLMIVADKPAESWTDEDVTAFGVKLSDLARRFKNLEALQKEVAPKGERLQASRITLTRTDGEETHHLVWAEHEPEAEIAKLVEETLRNSLLRDNPQRQQAFVAKLTERVLGSASQDNNYSDSKKASRSGV